MSLRANINVITSEAKQSLGTVRRYMLPNVIFITIALLLMVCFSTLADEGDQFICAACGKPITKQAVVVDGKLYHPECFRCAACGEPIRGEYLRGTDGKYYHRPCLERLQHLKCAYCGKPITDNDNVVFEGKTYHSECYRRYVAPHCDICGEPLEGNFITDYWGNKFHSRHTREFPVCCACGRLVWQGGVQIDDRHWLCSVCAKRSVTSPERARGLLEEVREELSSCGIVVRTLGLRIELVEREVLEAGREMEGHSHAYAYVNWQSGRRASGDETAMIRVQNGLPDDQMRGIIAHELMHVWQHENGADDSPIGLREGSANWAMSLIYSRMQTRRGQFFLNGLEMSKDPVYGEGYREVAKYADQHGVTGVLEMLKSEGR